MREGQILLYHQASQDAVAQEEEVGTKNINHPDHEGTSSRDMEDAGVKWVLGGSSEENEQSFPQVLWRDEGGEEEKDLRIWGKEGWGKKEGEHLVSTEGEHQVPKKKWSKVAEAEVTGPL
jgi:hypothetical protein